MTFRTDHEQFIAVAFVILVCLRIPGCGPYIRSQRQRSKHNNVLQKDVPSLMMRAVERLQKSLSHASQAVHLQTAARITKFQTHHQASSPTSQPYVQCLLETYIPETKQATFPADKHIMLHSYMQVFCTRKRHH